jgi:outer membrane receptor protein involved in Fe transport
MQQRQPRLLILTAFAGAFAISAAFAQTATETVPSESTSPARDSTTPVPMGFGELDANGDGAISKEEAATDPPLAQAFDTLDKDANGQLSPAEYEAYNVAGGR